MDGVPVQPGDLIVGKYRVERVLGEGGMGIVVSAHHEELEQRVAVKFLLPEVAKRADAAERFRREARAAAKINSEHVVRVLDVGSTEAGIPYMVMEYLEGNDISDELQARGSLPVDEAVGMLLQACEAVAEAHAAGIVHRDLKPANLFLAKRSDGTRRVKVLDFGISKTVSGSSLSDLSLTNTSALIGSPLYMSPEQMTSAKSVDARTDIWALGAILYQLLAGRPPYVADSLPMLCSALLNDTPPGLTTLRAEVPEALSEVVAKALAKDRHLRWANVAQFALALAPFAEGSRMHADRASRVLGSTADVPAPTLPTRDPVSIDVAVATSSTRLSAAHDATVLDSGAGSGTLDSWGKTNGRNEVPAAKSGRWKLSAVIAGVIAAGTLVAWGVLRTTAAAVPAAPATEPVAAALETAAAPALPPATTTPPVPAVTASLESSDAGAREPEPATPKSTPTKPTSAAKTVKPRTAPSPTPHSKTPALPDFGGRR